MYWEFIVLTTILIFLLSYIALNKFLKCKKNVCVVVLGDLGRSPRMQYHSMSLAKEGFNVDVVAYPGSVPHKELRENDKIQTHLMVEPPIAFTRLPRLVNYVLKTIWQATTLVSTLLLLPKSAFYIVQNPPCIPTLAVVWIVCLIRSSRLIVDWHNYGYSILSLSLRPTHPLVIFSRWYEKLFGRLARNSLCVSKAMQKDLSSTWNIESHVLYDRPSDLFKSCDVKSKHHLFTKLSIDYPTFSDRNAGCTRFTEIVNGEIRMRQKRPALIVSSTSWTEDEDFSVLLDALQQYENVAHTSSGELPNLVVAITGKGPLKDHYKRLVYQMDLNHVDICMPWLEAEDYPLLIGSADLGVCLHTSSSGLDLPMKVVDMFGCGLPVCAIKYPCLDELVKHDFNGTVFDNALVLYCQITDLLKGHPDNLDDLKRYRLNLTSFQNQRWHDNWTRVVVPLLSDSL